MYHHFIPISSNKILKKQVLIHVLKYLTLFKNKNNKEISLNIYFLDYIACFYDEFWWVGIAEDVSELDIKVRFMHPHGPVKNFFWAMRNDKC